MQHPALRKRVRQHVNPLSQKYAGPITPPDWSAVFSCPDRPLLLDIGSARGRFLLEMAQQWSDWNFLGLEIREPLVYAANDRRRSLQLTNLHFLFCNANTSIGPILETLPMGKLHGVTIQFPDPWFKKRHQKRRVVQPSLVEELAERLVAGGRVFLQSDIEEVAAEMGDRFDDHRAFVRSRPGWFPHNPFPAQTERECVTTSEGKPVYRLVFHRQLA
jgi:tRNA (guanine-N7-)-methyltransferase